MIKEISGRANFRVAHAVTSTEHNIKQALLAKERKLPGPRSGRREDLTGPFKVTDVSITLSRREEDMFNLLRKTLQNSGDSDSVTLRVCGGWVRDKILQAMGKLDESH